ncbi:MAG: hypothetical protein ABIE68_05095 [bacterium]
MKKLLVIIVLILLAGAAIYGFWYYTTKKSIDEFSEKIQECYTYMYQVSLGGIAMQLGEDQGGNRMDYFRYTSDMVNLETNNEERKTAATNFIDVLDGSRKTLHDNYATSLSSLNMCVSELYGYSNNLGGNDKTIAADLSKLSRDFYNNAKEIMDDHFEIDSLRKNFAEGLIEKNGDLTKLYIEEDDVKNIGDEISQKYSSIKDNGEKEASMLSRIRDEYAKIKTKYNLKELRTK